jgi:hypothetical protein
MSFPEVRVSESHRDAGYGATHLKLVIGTGLPEDDLGLATLDPSQSQRRMRALAHPDHRPGLLSGLARRELDLRLPVQVEAGLLLQEDGGAVLDVDSDGGATESEVAASVGEAVRPAQWDADVVPSKGEL